MRVYLSLLIDFTDILFFGSLCIDASRPPSLEIEYGEPTDFCAETAPGSEVFVRHFSKYTVQLDCGAWEATFTPV